LTHGRQYDWFVETFSERTSGQAQYVFLVIFRCSLLAPEKRAKYNQATLHQYGMVQSQITREEQDKIDRAVVNYVVLALKPLSTTEDESFVAMVKALKPEYKLPSRTTATRLFDELYVQKVVEITELTKRVKFLSYTADLWKSLAKVCDSSVRIILNVY
jgi:hypothetical protein